MGHEDLGVTLINSGDRHDWDAIMGIVERFQRRSNHHSVELARC